MQSLIILLAVGWALGATEETPTVAQLVEANKSARQLLHEFDAEIENHPYGPPNARLTKPNSVWRLSRKGDMERIRFQNLRARRRADGSANGVGDVLRDGTTSKYLANYDPEITGKLTPLRQRHVRGYVAPQTRTLPDGIDPALVLLFSFKIIPFEESRTLEELVSESPACQILGRSVVSGFPTWQLRVQHPTKPPGATEASFWDIYIDPSVNYHVRRAVAHVASMDGDGRPLKYDLVREIVRFRGFSGGVYFPVEVVTHGLEGSVARAMVRNVTVNEALPKDTFAFRFPENLLVQYPGTSTRNEKVELWGPNNEPVELIRSLRDLDKYSGVQRPSGLSWSGWRFWLVMINGAIVVALLGALLHRRRRIRQSVAR